MRSTMIIFELNNETRLPVRRGILTAVAKAAAHELRLRNAQIISLAVVADKRMIQLNRRYRHKGLTDVLSFRHGKEAGEGVFGEIIVAYPYMKKMALAAGLTVQQELIFLVVHGLLHIWGYDHEHDKDAAEMVQIERQIINRLV